MRYAKLVALGLLVGTTGCVSDLLYVLDHSDVVTGRLAQAAALLDQVRAALEGLF